MTSKFDWSQYETVSPSKANSSEGFDWNQYETVDRPSRARSLISAPIKGVMKGLQGMPSFSATGPISAKGGQKILEKILPTREELPEQLLERAGSLAPVAAMGPGGIGARALQVGVGALAGQLAKAADLGETGQAIAEIAGMGLPGLAKAGAKGLRGLTKGEPEKMVSGLTKPRAIEAKKPQLAAMTAKRQEQAIKKLNEEATQLTKKSVEKHVPVAKQIEEGFDFEKKFEKGFGELKQSAEKANPTIDITPVTNYLNKSAKKYHGIPKLHPEGEKVLREVRALRNNPQTGLRNLMKIYRSNNQKVKSVYESSLVSGKQKEYVDFLTGLNREIASSFKNTLPKDSAWVKQFETLNKEFKNYKDAQETLNKLRPVLEGQFTPSKIQKLASDPKTQRKLQASMGEQGAKEVVQIAQDLRTATEALKKIPKREMQIWDSVFPLGFFVPFAKTLGIPVGIYKGIKAAKYGYGYLLSTPARRAAYQSALKAISNKDLQAYKNAIAILNRELKKED